MVVSKWIAIAIAATLAAAAAVVNVLQLPSMWVVGVQSIAMIIGAFGIQLPSPSQVAANLPAHVASGATAALVGLNMFLQTGVAIPTWAHALIAAVIAAAAALGLKVTGVAVSRKTAAAAARTSTV